MSELNRLTRESSEIHEAIGTGTGSVREAALSSGFTGVDVDGASIGEGTQAIHENLSEKIQLRHSSPDLKQPALENSMRGKLAATAAGAMKSTVFDGSSSELDSKHSDLSMTKLSSERVKI